MASRLDEFIAQMKGINTLYQSAGDAFASAAAAEREEELARRLPELSQRAMQGDQAALGELLSLQERVRPGSGADYVTGMLNLRERAELGRKNVLDEQALQALGQKLGVTLDPQTAQSLAQLDSPQTQLSAIGMLRPRQDDELKRAGEERRAEGLELTRESAVRGALDKVDAHVKDYRQRVDKLNNTKFLVNNALQTRNWTEANASFRTAIRSLMEEVGALSEGDVRDLRPTSFSADLKKIENYWKGAPEQTFTKEQLEDLQGAINRVSRYAEGVFQKRALEKLQSTVNASPQTFKDPRTYQDTLERLGGFQVGEGENRKFLPLNAQNVLAEINKTNKDAGSVIASYLKNPGQVGGPTFWKKVLEEARAGSEFQVGKDEKGFNVLQFKRMKKN